MLQETMNKDRGKEATLDQRKAIKIRAAGAAEQDEAIVKEQGQMRSTGSGIASFGVADPPLRFLRWSKVGQSHDHHPHACTGLILGSSPGAASQLGQSLSRGGGGG